MANFGNFFIYFLILLLGVNSVFLFLTSLPNNQTMTSYHSFGLSSDKLAELREGINDFNSDSNATLANAENTGATATTQIKGGFDAAGNVLLGVGNALGTVISLVSQLFKYAGIFLFGYAYWIDYFLSPATVVLGGAGLFFLGTMIKAIFFLIQLFGLISLVVPIFASGRR